MAPVKDIRSFFKPVDKASQSEPAQPVAASASATPRNWSPRITRPDALSTVSSPTPSLDTPSTPSTASTMTPLAEIGETPQTRDPSNSQSSAVGGKRTIQNGETVVLNSDSDSDSDVLEDFDFGLKPKKQEHTSTVKTGQVPTTPAMATRATRSYLFGSDDGLRRPPETSVKKRSLSRLVHMAKQNAQEEKSIAAGKAELERAIEDTTVTDFDIDEQFLAGVVDDDEGDDKAKRLFQAMQRAKALDLECVYSFFGSSNDQPVRQSPFPVYSLPKHRWASSFEEPWKRDQAFLSGFARQIFERQTLPEELATWMIDQICTDRSNGLTSRYIELLKAHPQYLEKLLTESELNKQFSIIGANIQDLDRPISPSYEPLDAPKKPIPPQLKPVLQLLKSAADRLPPRSRKHTLLLLSYLCIDKSVTSDAGILQDVQDTIDSLLRYIPDRDPMLSDVSHLLLSHVSDPILQNKLVATLPTRSPMTASFRRHMALAFFVYPTPITTPLSDSDITPLIQNHLSTSKDLIVTRTTNYRSLAASLSLLDIGIGAGPSPVPCRPPPAEGESPHSHLSVQEISFNKQVDALVQDLKLLGNRIVEAGAISDLTRLEAKDCCERLCRRLENSVRIGGRPKRNIWGDELPTEQRQAKKMFQRWKPKGDKGATPVVNGDVGGTASEALVGDSMEL